MNPRIILASGSPRRRQLLTLAGIAHEVIISNADETIEGAPDYQVEELAKRKSLAVMKLMDTPQNPRDTIIIAADTLVYINGRVLGKPGNAEEAFEMLKELQGNRHTVYTGVAIDKIVYPRHENQLANVMGVSFVSHADVFFRPLSDEEIRAYIATGEPFDKAGAYGVQEKGAVLVARVEGDFYTVVGLPISRVFTALCDMGVDVWGTE